MLDVLADIVAPHESDHHQEQQLANTIQIREMRVFDVEACALQSSEHRFGFPAADVVLVQPSYPLVSDKLAVGEQAVDAFRVEKVDVALQQGDSFQGIGVDALGQHGEYERVGAGTGIGR